MLQSTKGIDCSAHGWILKSNGSKEVLREKVVGIHEATAAEKTIAKIVSLSREQESQERRGRVPLPAIHLFIQKQSYSSKVASE